MKTDKFIDKVRYIITALFRCKVQKISTKPFKSGLKINTVKGLTIHPKMKNMCYTFKEDGSYVECWRCKKVQ